MTTERIGAASVLDAFLAQLPGAPLAARGRPGTMPSAAGSVMAVPRPTGIPFSLVPDAERDAHRRRLAAAFRAIADEVVAIHRPDTGAASGGEGGGPC